MNLYHFYHPTPEQIGVLFQKALAYEQSLRTWRTFSLPLSQIWQWTSSVKPLSLRISLVGILCKKHFQMKVWILGSVSSFQMQ
ncbi:hypothetical protein ACB092_12G195900 [Castanea dentata]